MLVLRIELHDANQGGAVSELGRLVIANMESGSPEHGDYRVAVGEAGKDPRAILSESRRIGFVHDHLRASPVWMLVGKALRSLNYLPVRWRER